MSWVSVREVWTFEEAAVWRSGRKILNIARLLGLSRRELSQQNEMIPIQTLGFLWQTVALSHSIPFALAVAEAHIETKKIYGLWGEMMDLAGNVRERLRAGFDLMTAHADDPKWELEENEGCFWIVRNWHYPNTIPRAECFAAISELKEWLIVMQRHVAEPIQPIAVWLAKKLFEALREEELQHLTGFLGCPVLSGNKTAMAFPKAVLSFSSGEEDPEKFLALQRELLGMSKEEKKICILPVKENNFSVSPLPNEKPIGILGLEELDLRHRAALHHSALAAADYFSALGKRKKELRGVDIGGGDLSVTELLLKYLSAKTTSKISLTVVDPALGPHPSRAVQRAEDILKEHGVQVTLAGKTWSAFEKELPPEKHFDFAFASQFFSLLPQTEVQQTFRTVYRRLTDEGRFFTGFEPYDKATLPQYAPLRFFQRPVSWYREQAMEAGFHVDPTEASPAHADDPAQSFASLRFRKK